MARIVSRALQARLAYATKLGRTVTQREVADAIGITRLTLRRIEKDETQAIDFAILAKLCVFYGVGVGDILELSLEDEPRPEPSES